MTWFWRFSETMAAQIDWRTGRREGMKDSSASYSFSSSSFPSPPVPKSAVFGSPSEMELSDDYTCVISRGPNPKTTHIFDDCIVDSRCGVFTFNSSEKEASYPSESFLNSCDDCGKSLGQRKDICMYRKLWILLISMELPPVGESIKHLEEVVGEDR
ncbi:FCS-Like Zinc finger 8 [Linum grandiflorum]